MQVSTLPAGAMRASGVPLNTASVERGEPREHDGDRDDEAIRTKAPAQPTSNLIGQRIGTIVNTQA